MSYAHFNTLDDIRREYEDVVGVLRSLAAKRRRTNTKRKESLSGLPVFDPSRIDSAVINANDAYALLMIATSEGFMRTYLTSMGVPIGAEPNLSMLIDKCRKEFNSTRPRIAIRTTDAEEIHNLRRQRNEYAHGHDSSVFPPIVRVVAVLGRFFANIP